MGNLWTALTQATSPEAERVRVDHTSQQDQHPPAGRDTAPRIAFVGELEFGCAVYPVSATCWLPRMLTLPCPWPRDAEHCRAALPEHAGICTRAPSRRRPQSVCLFLSLGSVQSTAVGTFRGRGRAASGDIAQPRLRLSLLAQHRRRPVESSNIVPVSCTGALWPCLLSAGFSCLPGLPRESFFPTRLLRVVGVNSAYFFPSMYAGSVSCARDGAAV